MPEFEDKEERLQKVAAAAGERRDVWTSTATASVGTGRHPAEAVFAADTVLDAFDQKFPGLLAVIRERADEIADELAAESDDTDDDE